MVQEQIIIFIYAVALAAMLNIFVPAAPALTALNKTNIL